MLRIVELMSGSTRNPKNAKKLSHKDIFTTHPIRQSSRRFEKSVVLPIFYDKHESSNNRHEYYYYHTHRNCKFHFVVICPCLLNAALVLLWQRNSNDSIDDFHIQL